MLEALRVQRWNLFADGAADWLGQPLPVNLQANTGLPECQWTLVRQEIITASDLLAGDLLDASVVPGAAPYVVAATSAQQQIGQRWYANVAEPVWDVGLVADNSGIIHGLLQPVQSSRLPRYSGVVHGRYNAYGVVRLEQPAARILLLRGGEPLCVMSVK
mgnify:CR=1 FL=1